MRRHELLHPELLHPKLLHPELLHPELLHPGSMLCAREVGTMIAATVAVLVSALEAPSLADGSDVPVAERLAGRGAVRPW